MELFDAVHDAYRKRIYGQLLASILSKTLFQYTIHTIILIELYLIYSFVKSTLTNRYA